MIVWIVYSVIVIILIIGLIHDMKGKKSERGPW